MTTIETSLDKFRRLNERHQQQIDALTKPAKEMSCLAESLALRLPPVSRSPEITASIKATRAVMDRFANINIPTIKLPTEFAASMKATYVITDRYAASMKATHAITDRFAASMKATHVITDRYAASMKASQAIMDRFADIKNPAVRLSSEFAASMKATHAITDRFAASMKATHVITDRYAASMKASQAIMDRFADIRNPAVRLSTEFTASMKASQAIMDRFADIRVPALKQYDELTTIQMRIHKDLAPITLSNSRPALLHHRGLDFMPTNPVGPPVVSQVSPAEDVLRRISKQYQSQKRCEEDPRHVVVIAVTLQTGKRLCDPAMSAHGDHLIRIRGEDSSKQRYDLVVGYASFQYEILTIEIPPQSPTLRIV